MGGPGKQEPKMERRGEEEQCEYVSIDGLGRGGPFTVSSTGNCCNTSHPGG